MRLPTLKRHRSARTGRFTTKAQAKANQDTTVSETHWPIPNSALDALRRSLQANGLAETIRRLTA